MDPFSKTIMAYTQKGIEWTHGWGERKDDAPPLPWNGEDEFRYMEFLTGACIMGALNAAMDRGDYRTYRFGLSAPNPNLAIEVADILTDVIIKQYPTALTQWAGGGTVKPTITSSQVDFCVFFNDRIAPNKDAIVSVLEDAAREYGKRHPDEAGTVDVTAKAAEMVQQLRDWGYEVTATKTVTVSH